MQAATQSITLEPVMAKLHPVLPAECESACCKKYSLIAIIETFTYNI